MRRISLDDGSWRGRARLYGELAAWAQHTGTLGQVLELGRGGRDMLQCHVREHQVHLFASEAGERAVDRDHTGEQFGEPACHTADAATYLEGSLAGGRCDAAESEEGVGFTGTLAEELLSRGPVARCDKPGPTAAGRLVPELCGFTPHVSHERSLLGPNLAGG